MILVSLILIYVFPEKRFILDLAVVSKILTVRFSKKQCFLWLTISDESTQYLPLCCHELFLLNIVVFYFLATLSDIIHPAAYSTA